MTVKTDVSGLLAALANEPTLSEETRKKIENVSDEIAKASVFISDIWIYRAVIIVLGVAVLATILGGLGLAFMGNSNNYKLPAEIVALGSAAVGALAGLLAPSPRDET
jgi:hypothetical protein